MRSMRSMPRHAASATLAAFLVLTAAALVTASTPASSTPAPSPPSGPSEEAGSLTGCWLGDLPCADCAGTRHQLDLFPDGVFHLRIEYLGEAKSFDQIGAWALADGGRQLVLDPAGPAPTRLAVIEGGRLRLLDREGRPIESQLNYDLAHVATIDPFTPGLEMEGIYRDGPGHPIFAECLTGRELAVLPGEGSDSLRAAIGRSGIVRPDAVKLRLRGRIILSPARPESERSFSVAVDTLLALLPGETCGARGSRSDLEGTYWKLTRLGDMPVVTGPGDREAFLTLDRAQGHMSGSAGCNRLMGPFERSGEALSFGPVAGTKMACPGPLMERERAFTAALARVRGYRLSRHTLELLDEDGAVVARFEASERR